MLKEIRELEKELRLQNCPLEVFGNTAVERAKAMRYYWIDLACRRRETKNNNKKEKAHV